jgi:hypothetical protein
MVDAWRLERTYVHGIESGCANWDGTDTVQLKTDLLFPNMQCWEQSQHRSASPSPFDDDDDLIVGWQEVSGEMRWEQMRT